MDAFDPIDRVYPKVKSLTQALITAAAEQGATAEEFRMACARVVSILEKRASAISLAELQGQG